MQILYLYLAVILKEDMARIIENDMNYDEYAEW